MLYKRLFFLFFFFFAALELFSFGAREETGNASTRPKEERLAVLDAMEKLWAENNIQAYRARIAYARMAFPPDIITLTVRDGLVTEYESDPPGKTYSAEALASLTAESLFARLRGSLEAGGQGPMELIAEYDNRRGCITRLTRVPARRSGEHGQAPRDAGYSIQVLDFFVLP